MSAAESIRRLASRLGPEGSPERAARVLWSCIAEPGDRVAGALLARMPAVEALTRTVDAESVAEGAGVDGRTAQEAFARWQPRLRDGVADDAVDRARVAGARILTPDDGEWPAALSDLGEHAPLTLWARGDVTALDRPGVALVGARAASPYGEHVAGELSGGLAGAGVSVISGAAYGIDGAAHRAALASGGTTVAVLAGGCDRFYPRGHDDLLRRIVETGVVVAEVPCGTSPSKWRFLARNRIIAALSMATVVVEAGARSGSLNTAGHAVSLGRPLGAVPGPVTSSASAGCHRLLREYDAVCVTDAAEILELAGVGGGGERLDLGSRTDEHTRVRDALSARVSRTPDEIAAAAGMSIAEVQSILGVLALHGAVTGVDGGWRRVSG